MQLRIPEFTVRNQRSIQIASCNEVPRIMIITGPNGCGKSTLLDALRQRAGAANSILYVGPHRTSGRQQVQMRYLAGNRLSMRELQSQHSLPGYEGINIHSRSRSAWDYDETSSYLKYALCQVELDWQAALADRFRKHKEVERGSMPDVWQPLKEMTENLLPHLHFERIDTTNRTNIQCLWNVHAKNIQVDMDDLSSGEKAIIQLFFPLIENRVQALINQSGDADTSRGATEPICVLMDEPELHLHPNLQGKVLDYLRRLASREPVQFILATHSPTMVEQADSNELFLLRPSEMMTAIDNQLAKIASNDEKLEMIRDVFGTVSNVTALRTILVVEGRPASSDSRTAADERILSQLSNLFSQVTVLAGGGKIQCKQLARSLAQTFENELSAQIGAYALVDRDLEVVGTGEDPHVKHLPVSMIENLLVDPKVIWEAISLTLHKTTFEKLEDVEKALDRILDDLEQHEIDRRVKDKVGYFAFRAKDPLDDLQRQVAEHVDKLKAATAENTITGFREQSSDEVEKLKRVKSRRENYNGKEILKRFYDAHLNNGMMSREMFIYECARAAADRKLVRKFVSDLFREIGAASDVGDG